jgi:DnaJ family protein C protein 19
MQRGGSTVLRLRLSRQAARVHQPRLGAPPPRFVAARTPFLLHSWEDRDAPAQVPVRDSVGFAGALFMVGGGAIVLKYSIQPLTIWWNRPRAAKRYKGGFETEMTRREAALILGVRESADKKKVQEAYKRVMMLNHPDLGGSAFVTTKINEAKDMLAKGRRG